MEGVYNAFVNKKHVAYTSYPGQSKLDIFTNRLFMPQYSKNVKMSHMLNYSVKSTPSHTKDSVGIESRLSGV